MTFGIWNSMEKRFIFGIAAETPRKAERAFRKTCINWRKWRYEIKPIPEGFKNPRNPHYSHLRRKEPTMNANEIIIPARLSYANIWEARQTMEGDRMQYSCSLLIPKSDTKTVAKIKTAIEAAYREGEAKLKGNGKSVPALSVLKTPLRDGDLERPDNPAYAGSYFVNANAPSAPGIVDADRNPILTRSEVYSGVYGRASISFYAFNSSGNKGIACGLNNLQKIRDGEPLGGKASAESDFATDDDDDFLD